MAITVNDIKAKYTAQKLNGTRSWASLNINIKTAVCEAIKEDKNLMYSVFWENFKANNFIEMSNYLKTQFRKTN
jgi:hypothetical protein